jgi:hypothetical protein
MPVLPSEEANSVNEHVLKTLKLSPTGGSVSSFTSIS